MSSEVLVSLLITVVLGDKVKVVTTDNDGALHFDGDNSTSEDTSTNADVTSEGTLLVQCKVPSMASRGVLKPRPTSLYQRLFFLEMLLALRKTASCLWDEAFGL